MYLGFEGDIREMNTSNISVNTQSSIRITGSKNLYFDPFRIVEEPHDADIILITHSHQDHLDPLSISRIVNEKTMFIVPLSMGREIRAMVGDSELVLMAPDDTRDVDGISVLATPAYNRLKPFHQKQFGWLGYVVMMDGIRYYVSGDTDGVNELSSVVCDVALVPIGGTYTMSAKEAAKLVNRIHPLVAIPTHYGTIVGKPGDADTFRGYVTRKPSVNTTHKNPAVSILPQMKKCALS